MIPEIRNGVFSLDLLSILTNVVLIDVIRVEFEEFVLFESYLNSPVRYGLSISGPNIAPIPYINEINCRKGALFCCQSSISQTP